MVSGEKRNIEGDKDMEKVTGILLDIEGTTTSISFVKDTLFPYVKENLESYVEAHWNDDEFKGDASALKEQAKKDEEDKIEGLSQIEEGEKEKETLIKNVLWQMSQDRKTTALKQLQGHIWREGYKNGKLKGHDVVPALKKWKDENKKVYIFSSGSVDAQKLLFSHSEEGDLSDYISGYFDTTTGPKLESDSYVSIVKSMGCEKDEVLFLTDIAKEAEAARSAGLQTVLVVREGNAPLTDDEKKQYTTVTSFGDLTCENSPKRKKLCDEEEQKAEKEETAAGEAEVPDSEGDATSQVNGTEEMEVDTQVPDQSTDKTEDKTDEESKTDGGDDVEIDVVSSSEERKEEEVEAANCGEQDEAEAEASTASEPQVDAAEPTKEVLEASDPLDITSEEKAEEETTTTTIAEVTASAAAEADSAAGAGDDDDADKPEESKEEEPDSKEVNVDTTQEEASNESDKTEDSQSSDGGKDVNGESSNYDENSGDTLDSSGNLALNKMVPAEDKPEPAVEVKA